MLTLCLSAILLAAPIPKGADEGTIALVVKGTKSELLLLETSGKEIKRIDLSGLEGLPYTVKLFNGGKQAIVKSSVRPTVRVGRLAYIPESVYLVTIDGSVAPKELLKKKVFAQFLPNHDGTKLYCSELDPDKMAKAKPTEMFFKSWIQDLKTGKVEPIPIPSEYRIADISSDDSTILLNGLFEGTMRTATTSTTTWKPVAIENCETHALCLSRNGKQMFLLEDAPLKKGENASYCLYDLKSNARRKVTLPDEVKGINAMAFDNDGKRIAYFHTIHESSKTGVQDTYQVFISNPDGRSPKMIYSTTTEMVTGLDWR